MDAGWLTLLQGICPCLTAAGSFLEEALALIWFLDIEGNLTSNSLLPKDEAKLSQRSKSHETQDKFLLLRRHILFWHHRAYLKSKAIVQEVIREAELSANENMFKAKSTLS